MTGFFLFICVTTSRYFVSWASLTDEINQIFLLLTYIRMCDKVFCKLENIYILTLIKFDFKSLQVMLTCFYIKSKRLRIKDKIVNIIISILSYDVQKYTSNSLTI